MTDARLYSVRLRADVFMPNRDFEYEHRLQVRICGAVENGMHHTGDALLPEVRGNGNEPCPHLTCLIAESAGLLEEIAKSPLYTDLVTTGLIL